MRLFNLIAAVVLVALYAALTVSCFGLGLSVLLDGVADTWQATAFALCFVGFGLFLIGRLVPLVFKRPAERPAPPTACDDCGTPHRPDSKFCGTCGRVNLFREDFAPLGGGAGFFATPAGPVRVGRDGKAVPPPEFVTNRESPIRLARSPLAMLSDTPVPAACI